MLIGRAYAYGVSAAGEVGAEPGTSFRQLIERCQSIAEHGVEIQAGGRLVQGPESLHIVGIQFKQLAYQALGDFRGRQVHPIQSTEESQQIEPGFL